jgi:ribose 5-phosphate isomerase B
MHASPVIFASDHAGLFLKESLISYLEGLNRLTEDLGPRSEKSTDYPSYAAKLCHRVQETDGIGILICGTGLGMSMTANRFAGIRAALCSNEYMARMARQHNDANVLCLGSRMLGIDLATNVLDAFLSSEFEGGRHQRRVDLIESVAC